MLQSRNGQVRMSLFDDVKDRYPVFARVAAHVEENCGLLMRRALLRMREDGTDYEFAERLCRHALEMCGGDEKLLLERSESVGEYSAEFAMLQRELERRGRYRYSSFKEVEKVYAEEGQALFGPPYIWGMYFAQVFWTPIALVWRLFREFKSAAPHGRVIEVPCGNGVYLSDFLVRHPGWTGTAVDLSERSVRFAEEVLRAHGVAGRTAIRKQDFFTYEEPASFERVICGDFLEHVEDPLAVLVRLKALLRPGGRIFLSAAVWSANIDHIYLYENVEQVCEHIRRAGLQVENQMMINVYPGARPDQSRTPIHYCSILSC